MSTTSFNLTTGSPTVAVFGGNFTSGTGGGYDYDQFGYQSDLQFTVTGTQAVLTCYTSVASPVTVTVDGVTTTPTFGTLNAWTTLTLFTGLADAPTVHTVLIKALGTNQFFIDRDTGSDTLTVTGSAPAIGTPAPFAATNRQIYTPATNSNFLVEGAATTYTASGLTYVQSGTTSVCYTGGGLRFSASCTAIYLWGYGQKSYVRLFTKASDGTWQPAGSNVAIGTGSGSDVWGWWPIATGLISTTAEYFIAHDLNSAATSNYQGFQCNNILLQGSTGLAATPPATRGKSVWIGDSLFGWGYNQGYPDMRSMHNVGWPWAMNRDHSFVGQGIPSTQVSSNSTLAGSKPILSIQARLGDITALTNVVEIFMEGGVNDLYFYGAASGALAQFSTDHQAVLQALVTAFPAVPFIRFGMFPETSLSCTNRGYSSAQLATWDAQIAADVATVRAANPGCLLRYLSMANCLPVSRSGYRAAVMWDGVHETATGTGAIYNYLETVLGGAPAPQRQRPRLIGAA